MKQKSAAKGKVKAGTSILNVRLPKELILELDLLVKANLFNSRSEAIREFAREYVLENEHSNAKISERGGGR